MTPLDTDAASSPRRTIIKQTNRWITLDVWGPDGVRVRITPVGEPPPPRDDIPGAILPGEPPAPSSINLKAGEDPVSGLLVFTRVSDNTVILRETASSVPKLGPGGASVPMSINFTADPGDAVYGLGQGVPTLPYPTTRTNGLDHKGEHIDFATCAANEGGAANCIPWYISVSSDKTPQFGFLWNMPSFGGVDFGPTTTAWRAARAWQLDFFVTTWPAHVSAAPRSAAAFGAIMERYTGAVGRTPPLDTSLLGYWHSKNVYKTQAEVEAVMDGFAARDIPVDVLIIDIGGSRGPETLQGDWHLSTENFPDPSAMTAKRE